MTMGVLNDPRIIYYVCDNNFLKTVKLLLKKGINANNAVTVYFNPRDGYLKQPPIDAIEHKIDEITQPPLNRMIYKIGKTINNDESKQLFDLLLNYKNIDLNKNTPAFSNSN